MFYWVLPPLGLVVVLDGIVRFSTHIMRRDGTGKEWIRAMAMTLNNHVVLCGLGKLGIRGLEQLISLKQDVIVLEKNPRCPNIAFAEKHGFAVLVGTGREEGITSRLTPAASHFLSGAFQSASTVSVSGCVSCCISNRNRDGMDGRRLPHFMRLAARLRVR